MNESGNRFIEGLNVDSIKTRIETLEIFTGGIVYSVV